MGIKALIKKLPPPVEQCFRYAYGAIPISLRYGSDYRKMIDFLSKSQWRSREELEDYQIERLSVLIKHSYENVPYYRNVFNERGIRPKDIKCPDDLKKLPFLTREIICQNLPDLVAENYGRSKLKYETTGGSTGIPLGFYAERGRSDAIERAFIDTLWGRAGYKPGDRLAVLRGTVVKTSSEGKYWKLDPVSGNLILSSYHMTDKNLSAYLEKIEQFRPDFIYGYPSAITILARHILAYNAMLSHRIKGILCGSENLYDWQRELINRAFQCRVFSWYGHAEKAVLAGECEVGNIYHIFPEYGITELIDFDDRNISSENQIGEIVATGLHNMAMPLLRYRTMDRGQYSSEKCGCGRHYDSFQQIDGRLQELIITGDDRPISMTAINMHSPVFDNVRQFQFSQIEKGKIVLHIVRNSEYSEKDSIGILKELGEKLGNDIYLDLTFVDSIPRTGSGKFRFLVQKLPTSQILTGIGNE